MSECETISLTGAPGVGRLPFDKACKLTVLATLKAAEHTSDKRPRLDLVPVLDRSGSMRGQKIERLKEAIGFVIKELRDSDRLGVVSFGSDVKTELPMLAMDAAGRAAAATVTNSIRVGSMTNLSGGLLSGLSELRERGRPVDPAVPECKAVLLLTDGQMNQGITSADALVAVVKSAMAEIEGGASLFAFGLGSSSDGDTLRTVTDACGGSFYNLTDGDSLATAFGDCLGGLLSVVAQNVVLRVEAQGGAKLERVVTRFDQRVVEAGKVIEVTLPDLYSAEEKDVLVDLELPKLGATVDGADAPVVLLSLRYADAVRGCMASAEADVCVCRPAAAAAAADPQVNTRVAAQMNRVNVAAALDEAKKAADSGNVAAARALLDAAAAKVRGSFPEAEKEATCAQLLADLSRTADAMVDRTEWTTHGRFVTSNMAQEHYMQRCSKATPEMQMRSAYAVPSKVAMMNKMGFQRDAARKARSTSSRPATSATVPPPPPPPVSSTSDPSCEGPSTLASFFSFGRK